MSAVNRREVIRAYDRALDVLRAYLDTAEPHVLEQLVGHEPRLRELRDAYERATAPEPCEHVRGPHGTAQEATCTLAAEHEGPHQFANDLSNNDRKDDQ